MASLPLVAPRVRVGSGAACEVRAAGLLEVHVELSLGARGWEALALGDVSVGEVPLAAGELRAVCAGVSLRAGAHAWTLSEPPLDPSIATRELALQQAARWADDRRTTVPRVLVAQGADRGRILDLSEVGRTYCIGRGRDAALVLSDAGLSRRHAGVVRAADGVVRVRDAESASGTFVGAQRIPMDALVAWPEERMVRVGHTVLALIQPFDRAELPLPVEPASPVPPTPAATPEHVTDHPAAPVQIASPAPAVEVPVVKPRERASRAPPSWTLAAGLGVLGAIGALALWYLLR